MPSARIWNVRLSHINYGKVDFDVVIFILPFITPAIQVLITQDIS